MGAQILDGKALAASIKNDLAARTVALKAKGPIQARSGKPSAPSASRPQRATSR